MRKNEALYQDYLAKKAKGINSDGQCGQDMTHKMPACYQVCSEWCYTAIVSMFGDYYKGQSACEGFECSVASHVLGGQCCPWSKSCHNTYYDPAGGCNTGSSAQQWSQAAGYFTGAKVSLTGPMSQADLDKALNSGRIVMMDVKWDHGGGHVLMIGGCGNGYYYLHDPWGWYKDQGHPQPSAWQGLTYDQILRYCPFSNACGKWGYSAFWSWNAEEEHVLALEHAEKQRMLPAELSTLLV